MPKVRTAPPKDQPLWLTSKELAERCKVELETVRFWRKVGTGPKGVRMNGLVRYRVEDVEAWERQLLETG